MAIENRQPVTFNSIEDYEAETPEGSWELVEGVLYRYGQPVYPEELAAAWEGHVVGAAPNRRHQAAAGRVYRALADYLDAWPVAQVYIAPFGVKLARGLVLEPDVLLVLDAGPAMVTERGVEGPPDLVVEVVSPSSRGYDAHAKRGHYEAHGVAEFWLVWPERERVEVFRRVGGALSLAAELGLADVVTTPLLPGFEVALARLFTER